MSIPIARRRLVAHRLLGAARQVGIARPLHSQPTTLKEYFVVVWDKPGADRRQRLACDLVPPLYTFAGECLSSNTNISESRVTGNSFACYARNTEEVKERMRGSVYTKQGIWDLSTAVISPLMTIHTSEYTKNQGAKKSIV